MTVVSFQKAKEERSPHWAGSCKCVGCGHEWVGVGPMGTMWVDCPSCEMPKGTPKFPFGGGEAGDLVLVCNCGSEALTAFHRKGKFRLQCMGCGADQTEAVFG
jgi:hypothetical protein